MTRAFRQGRKEAATHAVTESQPEGRSKRLALPLLMLTQTTITQLAATQPLCLDVHKLPSRPSSLPPSSSSAFRVKLCFNQLWFCQCQLYFDLGFDVIAGAAVSADSRRDQYSSQRNTKTSEVSSVLRLALMFAQKLALFTLGSVDLQKLRVMVRTGAKQHLGWRHNSSAGELATRGGIVSTHRGCAILKCLCVKVSYSESLEALVGHAKNEKAKLFGSARISTRMHWLDAAFALVKRTSVAAPSSTPAVVVSWAWLSSLARASSDGSASTTGSYPFVSGLASRRNLRQGRMVSQKSPDDHWTGVIPYALMMENRSSLMAIDILGKV